MLSKHNHKIKWMYESSGLNMLWLSWGFFTLLHIYISDGYKALAFIAC